MSIRFRSLIIGMATYVPGVRMLSGRKTGGTISARYCYSVWLRHLSFLYRGGLPTTFRTVAELGPGDSLGTGLAALLCGAERYLALDVIQYASAARNLDVFGELIALFQSRAPIPDQTEFPLVQPSLPSYAFPEEVLPPTRMVNALDPRRLDLIRASLRNPSTNSPVTAPVCYVVPWEPGVIDSGTVDLIISQSMLEYCHDLAGMYAEMSRWLRAGGTMSHEVDFKSFGTTKEWNGHWACSDALWRLVAGRRRHRLNRLPHSAHIGLMEQTGCRVVCDERVIRASDITRQQLAPRFRHLTDDDLVTSSALIQAVKL
jgi:SAM-dependent methyltransferase